MNFVGAASSFTSPKSMRFNKVCRTYSAPNTLAQSILYPSPANVTAWTQSSSQFIIFNEFCIRYTSMCKSCSIYSSLFRHV